MRIIVDSAPGPWRDTDAIREALASVWAPSHVLVVADEVEGAAALAAECWARWGGRVQRYADTVDRYGRDDREVMRAADMVSAGADGVLVFQRAEEDRILAALARLSGMPVRTIRG